MKAAIFKGPNMPLEVGDVPQPEPGVGEVRIAVAACGLCHTDLHYLDHGVATFKDPPLILGHEPSGVIDAVGRGVAEWHGGERVIVPAVLSCGKCGFCRQGRENICDKMIMLGNNVDGAYAEYLVVPASEVIAVPDDIPLQQACVIADAISTPFHAVKRRGKVRAGDTVAVVGCGGVGLNVVQCARAAGATVIAIDINKERLAVAGQLGAAETIDPTEVERLDRHVKALTGGGVDVAFEAIGTPTTMRSAYGLLRKGGRLCVIGYATDELTISAAKLMYYELEVVGSLGCGGGEYHEIMKLVQSGDILLDPIVSGTLPLDDINDGFDRLRNGEGVRWVVTPGGTVGR